MNRRNRLRIGFFSTAAFFVNIAAAYAQIPPPPVDQFSDDNGVDAASGQFSTSATDISIGPDGNGGLAFRRWWSGEFGGGWRHSFVIVMNEEGFEDGDYLTVSMGNSSERFWRDGGGIRNTRSGGGTLELSGLNYKYVSRDGVIVNFDRLNYGPLVGYDSNAGIATDITYPDGTVVKITYKTDVWLGSRIQSVSNSRGYQLKFNYLTNDSSNISSWSVPSKITAINNAVEYCAADADSCVLSNNWPHASFTWLPGWSAPWITEAVDAENRVTTYTYDPTRGELKGIRRPGASQDDITIAYGPSPYGSRQVVTGPHRVVRVVS